VLMLSQLYDLVPAHRLVEVLRRLKAAGTTTLLCTGRPEDITLDGWFQLSPQRQRRFATREGLIAAMRTEAADGVPA
jgi:putative ABC transport system ATP-binding protein